MHLGEKIAEQNTRRYPHPQRVQSPCRVAPTHSLMAKKRLWLDSNKRRFTLVSTKMNWLCITVGDFRTGTMERTVH